MWWSVIAAIGLAAGAETNPAEKVLCEFSKDSPLPAVETTDATVEPVGSALRVTTGHAKPWPGIKIPAPGRRWDLSGYAEVALDVTNAGDAKIEVHLRVDNPGADGVKNCLTGRLALEPGKSGTLPVPLRQPGMFGMRGYPPGYGEKGIDPTQVNQVVVFVAKPKADYAFTIARLRAAGSIAPPKDLYPLIDTFGQYRHKDWPGKTHSLDELRHRREEEAADLAAHPGPADWDQYGGWTAGPKLEATGRFRTEKYQGKWWLVDPEGRLFWSHGVDCVRSSTGTTPISDRRHWYADLPRPDSPLAKFFGRGNWAPHNYYDGRSYETFNFSGANLLRKYGDTWEADFAELSHRRLRSWGMNTIANWSDPAIARMHKTTYTATVHLNTKKLEGSSGYWVKFHDVFDPSFETAVRDSVAKGAAGTAGDPWCLGYFLDNELSWGDELSLAIATIQSPAAQPAKQALVADLKVKYDTIDGLNAAWGTQHASWDAFAASTAAPDRTRAQDDLAAFYSKTAERYFQVCRDAVKHVDPAGLYLGCRFAWTNDRAVRAAAACDVISFNRYQKSVADLGLPEGIDRPTLIGEFHFGALDRGMFHTGLVALSSQDERAAVYRDYVLGAARNRYLVGTHWFQYVDQPTTGRGDGENYQIGLVDICDTPYVETVRACREVGEGVYTTRMSAQ